MGGRSIVTYINKSKFVAGQYKFEKEFSNHFFIEKEPL